MDDKQSVHPKTVPEEIQTIMRHWDEIDKSKLIRLDEGQRYTAEELDRFLEENKGKEIIV